MKRSRILIKHLGKYSLAVLNQGLLSRTLRHSSADQQLQDDRWQLYPEKSTGTSLSHTIKSCLPPATTANSLAYLVIDLNQPASVVVTQLRELLPLQISKCFYTPATPEKARNPRYETWKGAQVLAYIDLTFWRKRLSDDSLRK